MPYTSAGTPARRYPDTPDGAVTPIPRHPITPHHAPVDPAEAAAIFIFAAAAAFTQALSGFGFSLLLVPPLALAIGPREAVVLANLLGAMLNCLMAWRLRTAIRWRTGMTLLAAAAAGMPLGLAVLIVFDARALRIVIAITVLVSTALIWRGFALRGRSLAGDLAAGFVSGVLNTSTSMSGPPVVLYLQGRGLAPDEFRGTLAAFFLASSAIATVLFVAGGQVHGHTLAQVAIASGALAAGYAGGAMVYRRLTAAHFRGIVLLVLVASALLSLATALA